MIYGARITSGEGTIYTLFPLGDALYTDCPQDFETYAEAWQYAIEMGYEQYVIEGTDGEVV